MPGSTGSSLKPGSARTFGPTTTSRPTPAWSYPSRSRWGGDEYGGGALLAVVIIGCFNLTALASFSPRCRDVKMLAEGSQRASFRRDTGQ